MTSLESRQKLRVKPSLDNLAIDSHRRIDLGIGYEERGEVKRFHRKDISLEVDIRLTVRPAEKKREKIGSIFSYLKFPIPENVTETVTSENGKVILRVLRVIAGAAAGAALGYASGTYGAHTYLQGVDVEQSSQLLGRIGGGIGLVFGGLFGVSTEIPGKIARVVFQRIYCGVVWAVLGIAAGTVLGSMISADEQVVRLVQGAGTAAGAIFGIITGILPGRSSLGGGGGGGTPF